MFRETDRLEKILMLNGIKGAVTSGQDPSQLSIQFVKRNKEKLWVVLHTCNPVSKEAEIGR